MKENHSISKTLLLIFGAFLFVMVGCDSAPSPPSTSSGSGNKPTVTTQSQQEEETLGKSSANIWPFSVESSIPDTMKSGSETNILRKNFMVIFDGSGSMSGSKIEVAKQAVSTWVSSVPKDANVGLVAFHSGGWTQIPLAINNRDAFTAAIKALNAGEGTPLSEAFRQSFHHLTGQALKQFGYGEYTVVVVTDGAANDSGKLNEWVKYYTQNTPIQIFTIGFQIGENHSLNQPGITEYRTAENLKELTAGLKEVLAETDTFDATLFEGE